MNKLRHALSSRKLLLAAAMAVCLAQRPAPAQIGPLGPGNNYYPNNNAPINDSAALAFIESLLNDQYVKVKGALPVPVPGQTYYQVRVPSLGLPVLRDPLPAGQPPPAAPNTPPVPGNDNKSYFNIPADYYVIASDTELDIALGAAVQKLLDGTAASHPVPYTGTLGELVSAVAKYRKKSVAKTIVTATTNILNWNGFPTEAARTAALEDLTTAAVEAEPAAAANIVGAMLKLVVPKVAAATPSSPVPLGGAQVARSASTAQTAASLQTALNSLPEIQKKGGIRTQAELGGVRLFFGSNDVLIPNASLASAAAIQGFLNGAGLGISSYGVFTVSIDSANPVVAFQDDMVFTYKPINLNLAGASKWNLTPAFSGSGTPLDGAVDDILEKAIQAAAENAAAIVDKALTIVMQGVDVSGNNLTPPSVNGTLDSARQRAKDVAAVAIATAYAYGKGYLADEIGAAIGKRVKAAKYQHKPSDPTNNKHHIASSSDIVEAIFTYPGAPTDVKEIALVAAGLMKGFQGSKFEGGTDPTYTLADPDPAEVNIIDTIKSTVAGLTPADETYLDNVRFGFQSAYAAGTDKVLVGQAIITGMTGAPDEIAARLVGGAAWLPGVIGAKSIAFAKGSFIADVLELDAVANGNDTIAQIVESAVRASQKDAAKVTEFAAAWSKDPLNPSSETQRFGQIAQGAATGLKGQPLYGTLLGGAVSKLMAAALPTLTQITITHALDGPYVGQALKSPIKYKELDAAGKTQLKEVMSYAVSGLLTAGEPGAAATVAFNLAKSVKGAYRFYEPILQGAIDTMAGGAGALPDSEQWRAVLGVMAVNKLAALEFDGTYSLDIGTGKPVGNLQTLYALIPARVEGTGVFDTMSGGPGPIPDYDPTNHDPIAKGGAVIKNLQDFPKAIFNKAFIAFADTDVVSSPDATMAKAVLNGVGLASPKSAAIAAALAVKFRPGDASTFQTEAIGRNPGAAANVKLAVATASHVAAGTTDLFDYLNETIQQNPKYVNDIASAATIVAPNYAHIVAHAVAFTAPKDVAKAVPSLFNFSHITREDTNVSAPLESEFENRVDAAAAMAAAITAGIVEAKTRYDTASLRTTISAAPTTKSQTVEVTNLKNAIVAMVKQTLTLTGNTPVNSPWLPGSHADLSKYAPGGDTVAGGGEGDNNFLQSNGGTPVLGVNPGVSDIFASGYSTIKQVGPAGVITGFMSQVISPGDTRLPLGSPAAGSGDLGPVGLVIAAAAKTVKKDANLLLAIAQAAGQAARAVAGATFSATGELDIKNAIIGPNGLAGIFPSGVTATSIANAIHFGVLAAANDVPAAGAAGVINFAHHSLTGNPVTDIFGL